MSSLKSPVGAADVRRWVLACVASAILSIGAVTASAQQHDRRLSAPSVQAASMAGAVYLGGRSAASVFLNPATIVYAAGAAGGLGSHNNFFQVHGMAVLSGDGSGLGLGVRNERASCEHGCLPVSETLLSVVYGRKVIGTEFGVSLAVGEQVDGQRVDQVGVFDAGLMREVGPVRVGGVVRGIRVHRVQNEAPPAIVEFQVSTEEFQAGPLDVLFAGRVSRIAQGGLAGWRASNTATGFGAQIAYWPVTGRTFRLLVGLEETAYGSSVYGSLGGSFTGDGFSVEYSYNGAGDTGQHHFGFRWR